MTTNRKSIKKPSTNRTRSAPNLKVAKIGIVSRDYRHIYPNGIRDFSHVLPAVLQFLDDEGCDSVLFSSFSINPRKSYDPRDAFSNLNNIKAIFLEEFQDGVHRDTGRYVVYYRTSLKWKDYYLNQQFGSITGMPRKDIDYFVKDEIPKRNLGNCCVLLCGEINGVKYSKKDKNVHDDFRLRAAIPNRARIILNPGHDRMTRFEMKLKRRFLSDNDRWVISVWNKGKQDRNGRVRDGKGPAWTVFHDGIEIELERIPNESVVEVGILRIQGA